MEFLQNVCLAHLQLLMNTNIRRIGLKLHEELSGQDFVDRQTAREADSSIPPPPPPKKKKFRLQGYNDYHQFITRLSRDNWSSLYEQLSQFILKSILNPLPDNKILHWSKLKQIPDDILKCI